MKLKALLFTVLIQSAVFAQQPVRIAIAGLSHGHVHWVFNREGKNDIEIVGIYEEDEALAKKFQENYDLAPSLFYTDLDEMLKKTKPEAVSAFGAISEHLPVVEAAAPKGIHVMVEKPLAFDYEEALNIEKLAKENNIKVITNFETSWYSSNQYVWKLLQDGKLGAVRKVWVNDGHEGPKEIGVGEDFLGILVDPEKNGAGALVDFGCYGANLMTWLMKGEKPVSVTAITNQNKPEIYKNVDDEATIILQYPKAQCVIQASWNWPFSRKDMTVYGTKGFATAKDATTVIERLDAKSSEEIKSLEPRPEPYADPFSYLAAVVQEKIDPSEGLYGLPINLTVAQILDAAIRSAQTGKTIVLSEE
ncbi:MAG: Gfo/Idh/MocA family oxidoreductase [Bacteroidota bacterium]|nr:Gfo/Idh/MocA family oxidoreductase [Bacteroidota bacterium]